GQMLDDARHPVTTSCDPRPQVCVEFVIHDVPSVAMQAASKEWMRCDEPAHILLAGRSGRQTYYLNHTYAKPH
ncbi:MAG: hypothetical protein MN733_41930, partial [Nitrososphaera sp.]|nr:hypothetical protein [Nitrososphaera sp.]